MNIDSPVTAVAMSGGLDSSMAAALLVEQGTECIGIMMRLWSEQGPGVASTNKCCSAESVDVARAVADRLGMPFYLVNAEEPFRKAVVEPYIDGFDRGRTPNPCLNCNRHIRFDWLLKYALGLGAARLATGHHARSRREANGSHSLLRAVDPQKDQSYVLSVLTQRQLGHSLFPVGTYTKPELREMARQRDLPVADKQESMDLCFVADDDYRRFLEDWSSSPTPAGPIITMEGDAVGTHQGLHRYTIGQRRGLDIPVHSREPRYVIGKLPEENALVVGSRSDLAVLEFPVDNVNWIQKPSPAAPNLSCQIRYRGSEVPCALEETDDNRVIVHLGEPQYGVAPGQAAVFYRGDECLGGGLIASP